MPPRLSALVPLSPGSQGNVHVLKLRSHTAHLWFWARFTPTPHQLLGREQQSQHVLCTQSLI